MIFDTHAHYDDEAFDDDRELLLTRLHEEGVAYIVNVGASMVSSERSVALAEKYSFIYAAAGVHPDEAGELDEAQMEKLRRLCMHSKVKAVGEIGLDYYWNKEAHAVQQYWFRRQLALAKELDLPVLIHSREAAQDTLTIMKEAAQMGLRAIIHCYSYSTEQAREYLNMGYLLGIGGVLTFKNARRLKEVAEYAPLSSLVLETDCPYLAPVPYRGKRNDSSMIRYTAEALAEIKHISAEEVLQTTMENGRRFYGI